VGATASALAFLAGGGPDGTSLDDSGALVAAGFLLDLGAGPDDGGPEGHTPLMLAACDGNASMAKLLLESKASVDLRGGSPADPLYNPLSIACFRGHEKVASLLLAAAADPNVKTSRMPPLHLAAHSDSVEIVESLAAHAAKLDHKEPTWNGETALHLACRRGHFDVATALVALGASTKIKSFSSMTPMQTARAFKHDDLAAWLKASSEAGPKGKGGKGGKKARHAQKLAPAVAGSAAASKAVAASKAAAASKAVAASAAQLAEIEERHEQRLQEEAAAEQAADEAQQQRVSDEEARLERVLEAEACKPKAGHPRSAAAAALAAAAAASFTQCEIELSLSLQRQPQDVGEAAGMKAALHAAGEKATMVALPSMVDYAKLSVSTEPHAGTTLFFNVCLKTPPPSGKVLIAFRRGVARFSHLTPLAPSPLPCYQLTPPAARE